jgi:inner membrane protein YidH
MPEPEPVDYRFLLANERTFLAYVRTALALQVAGLGVLQFLKDGDTGVRETLGLALILVGSAVGGIGYRRFRSNEAAIRAGEDLSSSVVPGIVTVAIVVAPLLGGVLLLFT